jgi:hypothetical protein
MGHRWAITLIAFSSVAVFATAPLRAQSQIGPVANRGTTNDAAVKDAFDLTSPHDLQRRAHSSSMTLRGDLEFGSPQGSGRISKRQTATTEAIGSEAGEAPFAQSARPGSFLQSQAPEASGRILGRILDVNGGGVPGALIKLTNASASLQYTLVSGGNGEFAFTSLPPGTYFITVNATGFEPYTSAKFTISTGQAYELPNIQLSIATQRQTVVVRPTEVIAQMQMKTEEKQRLVGVLPNFYTSYVWNAAPLNTKQKFSLKTRDLFDPGYLLGIGVAAGIEQANNSFAGYGQGAAGYGKRFAAGFGDRLIGGLLSQAVFPSILHQDPRYFYQGSGSVKSRLIHALSWAVIARSDSGHSVPNYSYLLGDLAGGALSNLYYPRANRGAGLVFTNFAIGVAGQAADGAFREFVAKRLTRNVAGNGKP